MFERVAKWLKQRRCDECAFSRVVGVFPRPGTYKVLVGDEVCGATKDLAGNPTRNFRTAILCNICGKARTIDTCNFLDKSDHPEAYDEDGWPIDLKTGVKLLLVGEETT